jgi:ABC-type nitrate/sulfonate/bicarbonate transport system substrate-binding protein
VTHVPHEGGVMMVRAKDDIYRMQDLKGKKIGLSKSMNHQERLVAHPGAAGH